MEWSKKTQKYQFEDSVRKIPAITFSHLLFALLFAASSRFTSFINPHFLICLLTFLAFLTAEFNTDWKNQKVNIAFLTFYLLLFIIEFLFIGVPKTAIDYSQGYQLKKGVMMDIIIVMIPYIYAGIRFSFSAILVQLIIVNNRVKHT